jgi:hypothetical protein
VKLKCEHHKSVREEGSPVAKVGGLERVVRASEAVLKLVE